MSWKDLFESIYYVAATVAALGTLIAAVFALFVYKRNSRLERARWAAQLYEKFYERDELKKIRDRLDCSANSEGVNQLVESEASEFTDYLNFFEFIALLKFSNQLRDSEVEALFGYYLDCLKKHKAVTAYIEKSGYEGLAKLIQS